MSLSLTFIFFHTICHDCAYTRPPSASTFLTCFNGPSSTCFNIPHMLQRSVLHLLQRSSHASTVRPPPASTFHTCFNGPHMQSRVVTIFTPERGLNVSHTSLAHVNNTRVNVLLLVMFVYFSINSIAASHISLAFNSVFLGYIS